MLTLTGRRLRDMHNSTPPGVQILFCDFVLSVHRSPNNSKISAWAKASVLTAMNSHIMKGYPGNTFNPQGNATRAEAVNVILSLVK